MNELNQKVESALSAFNSLLQSDVATYNKSAYAANAPTVFAGDPLAVKAVATPR